MIIFKTVFKILNKLKGMLILYTAILIAITLMNTTSGNIGSYEATKPDIAVVNYDNNNLITNHFIDYLKENTNIKEFKDQEKRDDALFYRDISSIIIIPKNFGKSLLSDSKLKLQIQSNHDEGASYSEMLIKRYLKVLHFYKDDYKDEELTNKISQTLKQRTTIQLKSSLDTSKLNQMTLYFNLLNYAFLAGCVYCVTMILASLNEEHVRKRTIISTYPYYKYNFIVFSSLTLIVFIVYLFYMVLSLILFKKLMFTSQGILFMINSFLFALCSLSIGFLIGHMTSNKQAISGIVNVVALGSSFLCGCFVSMSYMPSYVLKIAHVLPSYYFIKNNELLKTLTVFNKTNLNPFIINGCILLLFTILFLVLTNLISKKKQRCDNE